MLALRLEFRLALGQAEAFARSALKLTLAQRRCKSEWWSARSSMVAPALSGARAGSGAPIVGEPHWRPTVMKAASLSPTARVVLTTAVERRGGIARAPERLPAAARRSVVPSLLKAGLLEEVPAENGQPAWRSTEAGEHLALRVTAAGLHAVCLEEAGPSTTVLPVPAQPLASTVETDAEGQGGSEPLAANQDGAAKASSGSKRPTVRTAALAVLAAWDDAVDGRPGLPGAVDALRAALTMRRPAQRSTGTPRLPRADTKRAAVLALLRRQEGATVAQVAEATGWATHTVRGFFAGLKKAGIPVEVLDRVRQVGPGKEGAQGSYTVYGITDAG